MTTQIFASYSDFINRADKTINGVSSEFAINVHDWEEQNITNKGCWNCTNCRNCTDCTYCWNCTYCTDCTNCRNCTYCWNCWNCTYCRNCTNCADCTDCTDCRNCTNCWNCTYCADCTNCRNCTYCADCNALQGIAKRILNNEIDFPIIQNIHQTVLSAVTTTGRLDMHDWHKCDTVHCWAGWGVHLGGAKGYTIEAAFQSTPIAALLIFENSCPEIPVSPNDFHISNEEALEKIKDCAEREKALQK